MEESNTKYVAASCNYPRTLTNGLYDQIRDHKKIILEPRQMSVWIIGHVFQALPYCVCHDAVLIIHDLIFKGYIYFTRKMSQYFIK